VDLSGADIRRSGEPEARVSYSFFGIQVAFQRGRRDPLPGQLQHLLARDATMRQSLADKLQFWKRASGLLTAAMPAYGFGDWDLVRGSNAQEQFDEWASEIEASLSNLDESRAKLEERNRPDGPPTYLLATMMVLVHRGSNADDTLGEWCDVPESQWLTCATFARLISIFPRLNFANVQADAIYIVPGTDREGLSADELTSEDYHHLSPLT